MFEYQIGEKTYEQKALVWGQVQQLTSLLKGISFSQGMTRTDLIGVIGDKMTTALAIVLTEKGKSPKGKNLEELAEEIAFDAPAELVVQIIEDFFACNPTQLYLEKLAKLIGGIAEQVNQQIISTEQSSS